eukprot:scaffold110857_cov72-Phaeocystis_antarctica.AAC.2
MAERDTSRARAAQLCSGVSADADAVERGPLKLDRPHVLGALDTPPPPRWARCSACSLPDVLALYALTPKGLNGFRRGQLGSEGARARPEAPAGPGTNLFQSFLTTA